jgi:hypothetical protein
MIYLMAAAANDRSYEGIDTNPLDALVCKGWSREDPNLHLSYILARISAGQRGGFPDLNHADLRIEGLIGFHEEGFVRPIVK